MASKGGLRSSIREGDALKKEVDAFGVECQGVIEDMGLTDRKLRLQKLLQRSKDLVKKATKAEQTVSKHTKGKEPTPISRFDEVKADEIKRLKTLKSRLEKLQENLVPDEVEEEYFRQATDQKVPSKKVSIKPSADSTLGDEESDEEEDEDEKDEEEEEEEDGEEEDEKSPSPKAESKLKRLSIFRRSSKSAKDAASKPKESEDSVAGETKKEKKDREKKEKLLEKERREQEKREKREKDKQIKEQKEREKREQKESKKGSGKGKAGKAEATLEEISERSEEEDDEDEDEEMEDSEDDEDDVPIKSSKSSRSPFGGKRKASESEDTVKSPKEKKGGSGWKLFQRKPADRKATTAGGEADIKETGTQKKGASSKKEEPKGKQASKQAAVELEDDEDSYEDEDDDEDEYEDEEEDGKEVSEEEEDVSGEEEELEDEEEEEEEDEDEEVDDEEDEEEEEDEYEDEDSEDELGVTGDSAVSDGVFQPPDEGMERFEAVCDFNPEQTEDLGFRCGDIVTVLNAREDGWWMAEDEEGNRGLVPSTYLKLKKDYSDHRDLQSPEHENQDHGQGARRKSGTELWKGLKKAMTETSVTDVLTAMGAIPSGFRPSLTARLLKEDQYTLSHILKPRLSPSSLAFKDLFWNPQENQIRARSVRVQKMFSVMMIKNMPQVGAGIEAKNRHIRVAVFDGEKVLSNIHTVQATYVESDPKTWRFSPKMTGMLPSALDGDCFVRTTHTQENIGLLFECCLTYLRTKTGEKGEFSCGWVHLPLFDETTGAPIVNKVYEVPIKGGTPFEQDVDVDPSISRKASTSKFRTMMTANKLPRLVIKLVTPTKEQKAELDTLPDTVVSSTCYVPALSFYRKLLADALLTDRIDLQNTDLIHSPVLASFPHATLYPDIMDALRTCWADKKRTMKKSDKRDLGQLKKQFSDACMESVYPLIQSATLPLYKFGDTDNDQERWEEISSLTKHNQTTGILHYLLQPGVMHTPFEITEVTFDLLEVYSEKR
ncbi:nephrocystin-1-like [Asterias rubens]|uniref:nephrocystin-1-like n=1 Tax=Asterias rubens TaxID=7604 RepID=UPI00145533AF|nr:nephrocystin-1-like [Asterias rubens]